MRANSFPYEKISFGKSFNPRKSRKLFHLVKQEHRKRGNIRPFIYFGIKFTVLSSNIAHLRHLMSEIV